MSEEVQDRIEKMIKKSEAILNAGKEKLKPCPFCGGEAELVCITDKRHPFCVRCKYGAYLKPKCAAVNMIPWYYKTAEEAIKAWNRRYKEQDDDQ